MKQMKTICKKISVSILTLLMIMTMYLSGSGESLFLKNRDVKAFTGEAKLVMSQALSSNKISEIDRPASEGLWSMTADGHRVFCLNSGKTMCSGDTLKYKTINAATYEKKGIAKALNCLPDEVYFTGGGSEADNWAIKGIAEALQEKGKHIITSKIEHHAVLHTCEYLEKERGAKITYIGVDENGVVNLDELEAAITPETILISVMAANNEIGTIQPIKEIGRIAKEHNILFHTDAVQAFGQIPINVDECNIDMLSSSGHKINGPKGIGFLYIRKGVKIRSFVHGGAQERKRRAGTENVPGIVGYGVAAERAARTMAERTAKEIEVRDYLINRILTEIPNCRLNGDPVKRLPNNCNISFEFIEGESLLIMLDMKGICASSGSACTSGSLDPSHVLLAIGLPHEKAHGSLRLTLSEEIAKEDVDFVVEQIKAIVDRLRSMSPLYEDYIKKQQGK